MKFHRTCHGMNITLTEDATVATRTASFGHGIVFGDCPVAKGERVTIEIRSTTTEWSGAFRFGFTNHDPDTIDPKSLPQYAIPNLTEKPGYWAQAATPTEEVAKGVKFSYFYTDDGVKCLSDGKPSVSSANLKDFESSMNIQKPVWPLFDLYGQTTSVKIEEGFVEPQHCQGGDVTPSVSSWSEADVQDWLKRNKLDDLCDHMEGYDGAHLQELYKQYCDERKEFEKDMKSEYHMSAKLYLKFSVALGKLFN